MKCRMEPATAENLLEAFRLFDRDNKGTLSRDMIAKLMTEEGEPFTQVNDRMLDQITKIASLTKLSRIYAG